VTIPQSHAASADSDTVSAQGAKDVLVLFSFLWGASVLFHLGSYNLWAENRLEVLAAFWVMLRPGSTLALAVLASLQISQAIPVTPRTPNHALFAALLCTAILGGVALVMLKARRVSVDRAALFRTIGPPIRLSLIVLYGFAVFHKLNSDWFDARVSCGREFYAEQRDAFPWLPDSDLMVHVGIYSSLGFELIIPLLLAFRRTRHVGILVGALFHWVLATNPNGSFYNFSSMLFAVFMLFAAPAFITDAANWLGRSRVQIASWAIAAGLAGYVLAAYPSFYGDALWSKTIGRTFWYPYGTGLMALFAVLLVRRRELARGEPMTFRLAQPALAAVPLLVFLNGLAPHIGLQTATTWAMFSNLRTEGARSNHWLIPASLQIFDYQRDSVRIVASSDPYLDSIKTRMVPYVELRRRPEASVTYVRRGTTVRFKRIADDPAYAGAVPFPLAQLGSFRPWDRAMQQECRH
jgi:hypothetical protein